MSTATQDTTCQPWCAAQGAHDEACWSPDNRIETTLAGDAAIVYAQRWKSSGETSVNVDDAEGRCVFALTITEARQLATALTACADLLAGTGG